TAAGAGGTAATTQTITVPATVFPGTIWTASLNASMNNLGPVSYRVTGTDTPATVAMHLATLLTGGTYTATPSGPTITVTTSGAAFTVALALAIDQGSVVNAGNPAAQVLNLPATVHPGNTWLVTVFQGTTPMYTAAYTVVGGNSPDDVTAA